MQRRRRHAGRARGVRVRAAAGARARGRRAERLPRRRQRGRSRDEEVELVERFATMAALAYDSARQRETLREQVQRDALTGLLNHRACHERLRAALDQRRPGRRRAARPRPLQGHQRHATATPRATGCSAAAAERLRSVVRADDVVGRMGGEEFVLILPGADAEAAEDCAERARAALAELTVRGRPLARVRRASPPRPVDGDRGRRAARERRRRAVLGQALRPRPDRALRARRDPPGGRAAQRGRGAARARARARSRSSSSPSSSSPPGRAGGYEALDPHRHPSRAAARTSGSRRRTASASATSSRRSPCAPRSRSRPPRGHVPRAQPLAARAAVRAGPGRAAAGPDGDRHRAHRARGVRRRGRARDRAGRAARPRRARRPRRRRRGLRGPAADDPDRARHPQARPHAGPRRARRRLAPGAAGGADRVRVDTGAAICAEGVEDLDDLRALVALDVTYAQGYGLCPPRPAVAGAGRRRRPRPARPRSAPACASRPRRAAAPARSRAASPSSPTTSPRRRPSPTWARPTRRAAALLRRRRASR